MKNTAIELPDFLMDTDDGLIVTAYIGGADVTEEWNKLQAKHEEELKQAVVKAYEEGRWVNSHISIPQRTAEQYYEANFNTTKP
ncbi:MAG: hypothetical protein ACJASM_002033 [Salibacteraceae bacterium]|jgi:hypothetical protein